MAAPINVKSNGWMKHIARTKLNIRILNYVLSLKKTGKQIFKNINQRKNADGNQNLLLSSKSQQFGNRFDDLEIV
jgi:hypothetical protein